MLKHIFIIPELGSTSGWLPESNQFFVVHGYIFGNISWTSDQ